MSADGLTNRRSSACSVKSITMNTWRCTGDATTCTIHLITSFRHYVHKISSDKEDTLEFVSGVGDRVNVSLTDDERSQLERAS